jgi:hypothetical protein
VTTHRIGLLLGAENDWPTALEAILNRAKLDLAVGGDRHTFSVERIAIEPFSLSTPRRFEVVIDRLAYWYFHPREWLKKQAMMNEIYLLNNPFTFQSMEKHTAFCGMMRLGLNIPETWLIPPKVGPTNERYSVTAQRYNKMFDIRAIGDNIGYPVFLKPFDGGGWIGVTKCDDGEALLKAYDDSGDRLMHLQKGVADYQVFTRSLSIGPQTMVMRYQPDAPMHDRYAIDHDFLDADMGLEVETISRIVNAFFRWEFNSCESIVKDGVAYPIDYANACPDVALTSLHYYFPWAMKALVRWAVYVAATGRKMAIDMDKRRWFEIADRTDLTYHEKIALYRDLTDTYFEKAQFEEFCAEHLTHLDEVALEYVEGPDFDALLVESVKEMFPDHEHDEFIAHFRGLYEHWVKSERDRLSGVG